MSCRPCRRCYVLAGGASKPLLLAMQRAAGSWDPEEYSAAGLAELSWALAACGQPLNEGCRQLLHAALGCAASGDGSEEAQTDGGRQEQHGSAEGEPQAAAAQEDGGPAQQMQQQQGQRQQSRDWAAWFKGTPASRVVLLLWAAAQLGCRPSADCLAAAVAALAPSAGLTKLPTKVGTNAPYAGWSAPNCLIQPCSSGQGSQTLRPPLPLNSMQSLVTLLWSLATLRAFQQQREGHSRLQSLLQAVTGQLARRMEAVLGSRFSSGSMGTAASIEQGTLDEQADGAAGSGWYSGSGSSGASMPPASPAELAAMPTNTLCTVVWACGQLRHADVRLLQAATTLLHGRVDNMAPADMTR